jgi:hypothetical protein
MALSKSERAGIIVVSAVLFLGLLVLLYGLLYRFFASRHERHLQRKGFRPRTCLSENGAGRGRRPGSAVLARAFVLKMRVAHAISECTFPLPPNL